MALQFHLSATRTGWPGAVAKQPPAIGSVPIHAVLFVGFEASQGIPARIPKSLEIYKQEQFWVLKSELREVPSVQSFPIRFKKQDYDMTDPNARRWNRSGIWIYDFKEEKLF